MPLNPRHWTWKVILNWLRLNFFWVLTLLFFSLSPGIKVSAEPLHEDTIVNGPALDRFQEEPAELGSKCTVTNNTHRLDPLISAPSVSAQPPTQQIHFFSRGSQLPTATAIPHSDFTDKRTVCHQDTLSASTKSVLFPFLLWKWWNCFIIY